MFCPINTLARVVLTFNFLGAVVFYLLIASFLFLEIVEFFWKVAAFCVILFICYFIVSSPLALFYFIFFIVCFMKTRQSMETGLELLFTFYHRDFFSAFRFYPDTIISSVKKCSMIPQL